MGFYNLKRLIRASALISVAMTMAIGCGDGKSKKRQPVNKNAKAGKIDPKTGKVVPASSSKETELDRAKSTEEARKKGEAESRFDGLISGLAKDGQIMDKSALDEGKYTLSLVSTALKYMPTSGGYMRAFRSQTLRLDAANIPTFSEEPAQGMGAAANNPDSGRTLEIPMSFEVKTRPFAGDRASFSEMVLVNTRVNSTMVKGDFTVDVINTATGARNDRATVKASVASLLSTAGLEDKKNADFKYSEAEGSKQIDLRLKKISDTKIRVIFEIIELKDTMVRTVVLDYDLVKAGGQAAPAAPAPAAPERAEGAPAPDNSAGTAAPAAPSAPAVPATIPPDEDQAR